jgi:Protein of unknown function (DUF3605)
MSAEAFTAIDETLADTTTGPVLSAVGAVEPLPYWLVNVPREQWPASCPEFLRELSDKNIGILATPDSEYQWIGWERVREFVSMYLSLSLQRGMGIDCGLESNDIGRFQRFPSDLRKYLESMFHIKQKYGSVMEFVLTQRLHWDQESLKPRGAAFEYDGMTNYYYQM